MGATGSGRRRGEGSSPRQTTDEVPALDVGSLKRKGMIARGQVAKGGGALSRGVTVPALLMPLSFREPCMPEAQFPRTHLLGSSVNNERAFHNCGVHQGAPTQHSTMAERA